MDTIPRAIPRDYNAVDLVERNLAAGRAENAYIDDAGRYTCCGPRSAREPLGQRVGVPGRATRGTRCACAARYDRLSRRLLGAIKAGDRADRRSTRC